MPTLPYLDIDEELGDLLDVTLVLAHLGVDVDRLGLSAQESVLGVGLDQLIIASHAEGAFHLAIQDIRLHGGGDHICAVNPIEGAWK